MVLLLRELFGLSEEFLSPLGNNIAASISMVLWFKVVMESTSWLRNRFRMKSETTRQILHISLSSMVLFWPLFDLSDCSWRFNILLPSVLVARIVYKVLRRNDPNNDIMDDVLQNFSLSSSPYELLWGPLQLCFVLIWLGLYQFQTAEAAVIMSAVGLGDGLAPLVGMRYGRHRYQLSPFSNIKTMEGSVVGVFVGTVVGCYFYLYFMGITPLLPLRIILVHGGIAAVMEGTSPGNFDNVCLPLVLHFSMERVQDWLCPPSASAVTTTFVTAVTAATAAAASTASTATADTVATATATAATATLTSLPPTS